jgi:CheY-like chemotaxis protein
MSINYIGNPMPDPLTEDKSKPVVLVIEDNPVFLGNAVAALKTCKVIPVMDLEQALRALESIDIDFILSDVHFPEAQGQEPKANVAAIIEKAYEKDIPLCFVTKADHHGLLDLGDEGYVSLKAITLGDIAHTRMELAKPGEVLDDKGLFRKIKASESKNLRTGDKTPEVWNKALEILRNASTKSNPLGGAIKQVRRTIGLDVTFKDGMPRLALPKK